MADRIETAMHAKRLLDDEVLKGALDQLERDAIQSWRDSHDPVVREQCWYRLEASAEFARLLRSLIGDGAMAARTARKI